MNDHIAKPIDVEKLFATLARWVRPAGSAVPPPPPGSADPLPDLPGIEVQVGYTNTAGNDALYRRILRLFRSEQQDFVVRFRAALESGDASVVLRTAHDLKSGSGTIGATALNRAAEAIEAACATGAERAALEELLDAVESTLKVVVDGLQRLET